jgi:hypothetical protein
VAVIVAIIKIKSFIRQPIHWMTIFIYSKLENLGLNSSSNIFPSKKLKLKGKIIPLSVIVVVVILIILIKLLEVNLNKLLSSLILILII